MDKGKPLTPSSEDMLSIAKKVYHGREAIAYETHVEIINRLRTGMEPFNPSLTGTDREKAQALEVIVAAEKLPTMYEWDEKTFCFRLTHKGDILERSLLALKEAR